MIYSEVENCVVVWQMEIVGVGNVERARNKLNCHWQKI